MSEANTLHMPGSVSSVISIMDDDREITSVTTRDQTHMIGMGGITAIEVYREMGEMGPIPWIAFFHDFEIIMRMDARNVTIRYKRTSE